MTLLLTTASSSHADLATALSSYLVLVVVVAATGGVWPAVLAALAGFLLSNYYFAPPIHTFTITNARDILALVMFLVTAGVVSVLVDLAARRTATALQARSDARTLARVAGRMVAPEGNPLPAVLDELVVAFRLEAAAVLRSGPEPGRPPAAAGVDDHSTRTWSSVVAAGPRPPLSPAEATVVLPLTDQEILAIRGPGLSAEDRDILAAFAAQLATALQSDRLHAEAAEADALAKANQLRSALLAAVSHDLRTPLASIKAAASSLLSDQLDFGPEETHILLQTIDDESDRMSNLVENLLDMSRLETGSMDVLHESTDVGELIAAAIESLGPRGAEVTADVPVSLPRVSTDPVLLERAVANLVDNALIHARGRGLRIEAGPVSGRVDIRVIDRGPGIPREDRDVVFQPFQRLGDAEHRVGVGLGLAVSRGFVEAAGGERWLHDGHPAACHRPGGRARPGGSRRGRPDAAHRGRLQVRNDAMTPLSPQQDHSVATSGESGTKVLVVDDDAALLRALTISLTARGYEVVGARSGEEGLDRAAHRHPDIVLLDLGLPGIDGREVIQGLRGWSSVPIIVLSARHQSVSKVQALDLGADDYLTKPFGMDELLARLRAALRRTVTEPEEPLVEAEGFTVDLVAKRVTRAGVDVHLTPKEWDIVEVLVRNPGRLVSQRQLLQDVWGPGYETETEYLRVLMGRVRRKLELDHSRPRHFRTEPGMGYRFEP